jgi:hypothetical protein
MKKVTKTATYDTETATLVKKVTVGAFGESTGYEESLYVTDNGKYFLYVNGGEDSKYPTEDIKAQCTVINAWKKENL